MTEELSQPTSLNVDEAADQLLAQFESEKSDDNQVETDDQEAAEAEDADTEVTEPDDQTEEAEADEADSDADDLSGDDDLFIELDGEEVSLAQLKEWREGGLKSADYTKKTQALAEDRREVETSKIQLQQELQALQAERAQLQDALAAAAIDGEMEPNWVELARTLSPAEYQQEQALWHQKNTQKQQVAQAYQALQAQELQKTQQREMAALLRVKPEWSNPQVFNEVSQRMVAAVAPFGITPDEISAISDHKQLLVLDALATLSEQVRKVESAKDAVSKRVVKAEPRRKPGARSPKGEAESKIAKARNAKFAKTRSINDAVDAILAGSKS